MSHIVTVQTEVRDPAAVRAACRRLGLSPPVAGTTRLFRGEAVGMAVQLPDWVYPVVCDTACGQIRYDNFEGRWGDPRHLDRLVQAYAAEKVKIEARKQGHLVTEAVLPDGSIRLCLQVAGGAA